MWMSKKTYTNLIDRTARAESARDWALTQVNLLNTRIGQLEHELTGKTVVVPKFKQEALRVPTPEEQGEVSFEDMGDDEARKHGYTD